MSTIVDNRQQAYFNGLDGMRGLSSIAVLCTHLTQNIALFFVGMTLDMPTDYGNVTGWEIPFLFFHRLQWGLQVFFVLSGFLIIRSIQKETLWVYFWRRLLRIYPIYAFSFLVSIFVIINYTSIKITILDVIINLLFLNGMPDSSIVTYNFVTWSMFFEVTYYITAPFFMAFGRWLGPRIGIKEVFVTLIAMLVPACILTAFVNANYGSYFSLIGGAAIALLPCEKTKYLIKRLPRGTSLALMAFAAIMWNVYEWASPLIGVLVLAFFAFASCLVMIDVCYTGGWARSFFSWSFLRWLGRISYSTYLFQAAVMWFMVVLTHSSLMNHIQHGWLTSYYIVLSVVGTLVAGMIGYWLVELPAIRFGRRLVSRNVPSNAKSGSYLFSKSSPR